MVAVGGNLGRRMNGWVNVVGGGKGAGEIDTVMCAHCNAHHPVHVGVRPEDSKGGMCYQCMKFICQRCQAQMMRSLRCDTFEKKLDRMEGRKVYDKLFAGAKL